MPLIFHPRDDRADVEAIWTALTSASRPSYFLSWPWIENWLATLPDDASLRLHVIHDDHGPVAAWFIGERLVFHGGLVPSRARFLNATGIPEVDELTIEHNGWVGRAQDSCHIDRVIEELTPGWDELVLNGMEGPPDALRPQGEGRFTNRKSASCYLVDLEKVRCAGDYLSLLGTETRSQIRRSEKLYRERGDLTVEVAADLAGARSIFDELVQLHEQTWAARGAKGAFSPYVRRFHERLITRRFEHGETQLLRVRAGGATIGCLYGLVDDGVISFYQSGVAYEDDNRLKPGLVCHAEAIRHNAAAGRRTYDFLGGDARYKKSLATDVTTLSWCTVQKPRLRFVLEDHARSLCGLWREWRAPAVSSFRPSERVDVLDAFWRLSGSLWINVTFTVGGRCARPPTVNVTLIQKRAPRIRTKLGGLFPHPVEPRRGRWRWLASGSSPSFPSARRGVFLRASREWPFPLCEMPCFHTCGSTASWLPSVESLQPTCHSSVREPDSGGAWLPSD